MSDFGRELARLMAERGVGVRQLARACYVNPGHISNIRNGKDRPSPKLARAIDDYLGVGGELAALIPEKPAVFNGALSPSDWDRPGYAERHPARPDTGEDHAENAQAREMTSAIAAALHVAPATGPACDAAQLGRDVDVRLSDGDALASALTDLSRAGHQDPVTDTGMLAASVDAARAAYQNCRYTQLTGSLADLIVTLNASCAALSGDALDRAHMLSADAHHVAAGLMLKRGDLGMAALAADRSMRAALASGDPVAIASSARITTHALMSGGHLPAAVATATSYATRLDRELTAQTPQSLSVYGALLLRGAVAAAQADDRRTAAELLSEAEEAARRLGHDGNYCWTAFGPLNTALHQVSVAVTLGDAGAAIDTARSINIKEIAVTERKATLLIDIARALLQRGRHENAYRTLRAAHQTAPEEVAGRAAVLTLVRNLAAGAPVSVRRDAAKFAASIGATT